MLDLVVKDGRAAGIVCRDLNTGEVFSMSGHAVVLATGGYGNVFYLSTNAKNSNVTAAWRAAKRGAYIANPCFTQIHPTCIPASDDFQSKLTLMSESLRNDGRVWVPTKMDDTRSPDQIPEADRDYFLERRYPAFGNLVPRDVASRAIKREVDAGRGVGPLKNGVYLDFAESIERLGRDVVEERYGNLFEMYERITGEDPYVVPMRIYPAIHYTMGGLWVDYNLHEQPARPVRARRGELLRPRREPAGRVGADAGSRRRLLRAAVHDRRLPRAAARQKPVPVDDPAFREAETAVDDQVAQDAVDQRASAPSTTSTVELGKVLWDNCGMSRTEQSLTKALSEIPAIREEFWKNVRVLGENETRNQSLEKAGRVADFLEFGELLCCDALHRNESCGGHFREEYQTEDGEALRDDEHFAYVAAWEFKGVGDEPVLHKEALEFEYVHPSTRSYK